MMASWVHNFLKLLVFQYLDYYFYLMSLDRKHLKIFLLMRKLLINNFIRSLNIYGK